MHLSLRDEHCDEDTSCRCVSVHVGLILIRTILNRLVCTQYEYHSISTMQSDRSQNLLFRRISHRRLSRITRLIMTMKIGVQVARRVIIAMMVSFVQAMMRSALVFDGRKLSTRTGMSVGSECENMPCKSSALYLVTSDFGSG